MEIEIEVKAKCKNLPEIKSQLKKLGAKFIGKRHQIDTYYLCKPRKNRKHWVPMLRIRENKDNKKYLFEYHEPIDIFKAHEYEMTIDNPKTAKTILKKLKYDVAAVVDKVREQYTCRGLNIVIDQVASLGQFIEVECMKNKKDSLKNIYDFYKELGLNKSDLIPEERYVDMIYFKKRK